MKQTQIFSGSLALFIIILQLFPLLWNRPFYSDWTNHIWFVEYYSRYFSQHFQFPTTIDVDSLFGNPLPSFYGIFFYPFLALCSIFMGSDLTMRIFCAVILIVPMILYTKLFFILTKERSFSILLAIIVNSSIYQLTNLYMRNALTEFAAYQMIILSMALILIGIFRKSSKGNAIISLGFSCLALGLGFHPITFYTLVLFCIPLIFMLGLSFKKVTTKVQLLQILIYCGCIVLALLPWIFNVLEYAQYLFVSALSSVLEYFPLSIDSIKAQIGLFYMDSRVLTSGIAAVSTPFLDAPFALNIVAILTIIFFICLIQSVTIVKKSRFVVLTLGLTVLTACLIIAARSYYDSNSITMLKKILSPIQFAYRLANTFSIAMIIALIIGLFTLHKITPSISQKRLLLNAAFISVFLSIFCVGQKLFEITFEFLTYPKAYKQSYQLSREYQIISQEQHLAKVHNIERYPTAFWGTEDYTMNRAFSPVTQSDVTNRQMIDVSVKNWNTVVPFTCNTTCFLKTNIAPILFYDVLLDGLPTKLRTLGNRVVLLTDSGSHTLEVSQSSYLPKFILISIWVVILWFIISLFIVFYIVVKNKFNALNYLKRFWFVQLE